MNQDLLCTMIYELLNRRDVSPAMEARLRRELALCGCPEARIEFERRVLIRFRRATVRVRGQERCPDRLRKKILALLEAL